VTRNFPRGNGRGYLLCKYNSSDPKLQGIAKKTVHKLKLIPKPPKWGLKNAKCPKFEQYAAITLKRYEIGYQLLLITNRKSYTGF